MKILKSICIIPICILGVVAPMLFSGCKKFVDVDAPSNQLVTSTVYTSDNTIKSALAGMFVTYAETESYDTQFSLAFVTGNSADETQYFTSVADFDPFIKNSILTDNNYILSIWSSLYTSIYQANAIIAGVNNAGGNVSDGIKKEALGEAKFMRALCYFYLTNLWGDVPLAVSTDPSVNSHLSRTARAIIYQRIIQDLTDARDALQPDYSFSNSERIRPNKFAALGLLARVYLYNKDWADAEASASAVISNSSLYSLLATTDLANMFVENNDEAILQFSNNADGLTAESGYYALDISSIPDFQLTPSLVNAFESGDQRFTNWVGVTQYQGATYYYLSKYKNNTIVSASPEYCTYMRLAEQYLIRAEARAQQNNLTGAVSDINIIRKRAGLGNTTATSQRDILLAVEQERRVELFSEYGHRWNDLRRTGRADAVLGAAKPGWKPSAALYPIPQSEIRNNNNLTQNPGY